MGNEVNVLRVSMVCLVLVAVLLLLAVVALGVGSAGYSLQQIIQALFYDESGPVRVVVYNLRLPSLIMAFVVVSDFGFISAAFCFWRCGVGLCTYLFAGLARWD